MPLPHRRQQRAEARPLLAARTTAAHVFLKHHDVSTAQPAGLIGERLLPPRTLGVGAALMARGLPDLHLGVAVEMGRTHLGAHADTPRSGPGG
jgi:hypothetical protein